jgi:hypothetical protein
LRPWHYHYSPEAAAVLPRYRCWALIDGVLREYTQASIVPLSGAGTAQAAVIYAGDPHWRP